MSREKKPRLIVCGALKDEVEKLVEQGSLDADLVFFDMTLHNDYNLLERRLKSAVEESLRNYSRAIVLVYGDLCLGNNDEMKKLADNYGIVKIDASNCIDCLLGGKGKIFEIDPDQTCFFLSLGMLKTWKRFKGAIVKADKGGQFKKLFGELRGVILLDTLGNLGSHEAEIEDFSTFTGLPVLERKNVGLTNLQEVISEAIERLEDL